jgi:hypothetical protein
MASTKMKALHTFLGQPGEGDERGKVRMGREFSVATPARAKALETSGLATTVRKASVTDKATTRTPNKAAQKGPTKSAGGKTGAAKTASSSRPAPAPSTQKSGGPAGAQGS